MGASPFQYSHATGAGTVMGASPCRYYGTLKVAKAGHTLNSNFVNAFCTDRGQLLSEMLTSANKRSRIINRILIQLAELET